MTRVVATATLFFLALSATDAQKPVGPESVGRWVACPGWVTAQPTRYAVTQQDGALAFVVEGKGAQMPWVLSFRDDEMSGDLRYLLVRYRAEGVDPRPGEYFLHGYEGTPGGRLYAWASDLQADGQWHTLAVDLVPLGLQEPTAQVAVKVTVGETGKARLLIERIWLADALPEGAALATPPVPDRATVVLDWRRAGTLQPEPRWTSSPASDFSASLEDGAMAFVVRGAARQMRWRLELPNPVDLARMPHVSFRYRASGHLAPTTYALWLGDRASGDGGHSCIPIFASDLKADGQWHTVSLRLRDSFQATQLAVGLDSAGPDASMALSAITFGSTEPKYSVASLLEHAVSLDPWPAGREGWTLAAAARGGRPSPFFADRLGLSDWFAAPHVNVTGIPFTVPETPGRVPQTGTAEMGTVSVPLPPGAKEVYLLTAVAAPPREPFGIEPARPRPVEVLSEPEKVVCEIRYRQGPPDFVIPVSVVTRQRGLRRGLGVHVVHPDPQRQAVQVLLHDRMQTASFAVLGTTVRTDRPRVAEPDWSHLHYPSPPRRSLPPAAGGDVKHASGDVVTAGALRAVFARSPGLRWSELSVPGLRGGLACAAGPVFEVTLADRLLAPDGWEVQGAEPLAGGRRFTVANAAAGLLAIIECVPGKGSELLLRMRLRNTGPSSVTATLRFPVLDGVRLGSADETWYLSGRRGGIIHSSPVNFRDPLGEPHPLQMDGFFNPRSGLALACLTHDTVAQHHFIRLDKSTEGGAWSPEYVRRDIPPGGEFIATEAALVLRPGDWRAIFDAYREWLSTWYRPPARKPWFERTFAFITRNSHYDSFPNPRDRGAIQPVVDLCRQYLGVCDFVHLFGWGASKRYGDWGDYGHYRETVGGLGAFRANIRNAQRAGIAVGLYLDGYLSSAKGQIAGSHALEWATRRPDGSPGYVKEYDAYNQCPYSEGWQAHLSQVYARIVRDLGARGMYVDEYGATDGRWMCHARDHGHNGWEIPYAGEVAMLRRIRAAVGPEVALYTEYPPAEVSREILDGSFTYQALWSVDQEPLAPHFIDLPRFAFPAFKQFHIIHYVAPRAGNWWLLKFPFFNGESYDLGEPNLPTYDAAAMAFQRRAIQVLCEHREAFSSTRVRPLVDTLRAGVFANEFSAAHETVWTLYNANGRTFRGPLLRVRHQPGARYVDGWGRRPLQPAVQGGWAVLSLELGPKALGCIVQTRPGRSQSGGA